MKTDSEKRISAYRRVRLAAFGIFFTLTLVGCIVGPSDIGVLMRRKPTEWTETSVLSIDTKGIDPIDTAEELGKSLKLEITRNNRYAVALSSNKSGGGWGSIAAPTDAPVSMTGEIRTTVIGVSIQPSQGEKQSISISVYVDSNSVEPRTEAQKVMAEFKAKLMEKIKEKQAEGAKNKLSQLNNQ